VGIAIGVTIAVVAGVLLLCFFRRRAKRRQVASRGGGGGGFSRRDRRSAARIDGNEMFVTYDEGRGGDTGNAFLSTPYASCGAGGSVANLRV